MATTVLTQIRLWPSALDSADVAKCYVCDAVVRKHHMVCIGKNKSEADEPRSIWRCKTCTPGSQPWWDVFLNKYGHEEPFRSFSKLFEGVKPTRKTEFAEVKKFEEKARRKVIVTKRGGANRNVSGVRKVSQVRKDPIKRAQQERARKPSARSVTIRRVGRG